MPREHLSDFLGTLYEILGTGVEARPFHCLYAFLACISAGKAIIGKEEDDGFSFTNLCSYLNAFVFPLFRTGVPRESEYSLQGTPPHN